MTPQNLSLWICWKLFWATLNPNWLELRIRRDQNTRKIVYIFASYEEKWLVQVSFWQFCWPLMLRAQLPYSRNVAEMNSWTVYHINIFGEWWTSSYWKFRHKRVNPLLKEPWRGVASTPASPLCLSVVKSCLASDPLRCTVSAFWSWRARPASFVRECLFWQRSCGDQGTTKPRGKLITVLPAAEAPQLKQSTFPASYAG